MLSQTAQYAIRAAVHLAGEYRQGPARVDDIAEALGIPKNYLSKILHGLAKAGLLTSRRGPRGGFRLIRPPADIRLEEVVGQFDPLLVGEEPVCLLGRSVCSDRDPCAAHARWGSVREEVRRFFAETSLEDLLRRGAGASIT